MKSPFPTRAAGWISIPVAARLRAASVRGTSGTPAPCSAWATRWASRAWTPGHERQHLERPHAARGRVAVVDGVDVAANLAEDARHCPQAEHRRGL